MQHLFPNRLLLLGGVALLLFVILIARWFADWGLVTIHVKDAPEGGVITSISRQGHVRVESSLDPSTPVTMDVDKVPPAVAVDMLATRTDASWRTVYLAAPTKALLNEALIALRGRGRLDGWTTYFYPGPPATTQLGLALDPRYLRLKMEGPARDLSSLLDEASQKSGVMTALPGDWSPTVQNLPRENQVRKTVPALIAAAHGKTAEFFLLVGNHREGVGAENADTSRSGPPGPKPNDTASMNPEWGEQRQLSQIQLLPPQERVAAQKEFDDRKALVAQLMKLPPEERMAKIREMMSNPDNLTQMVDQVFIRLASQPAKRLINLSVNYLNQKTDIKSTQGTTSPLPSR